MSKVFKFGLSKSSENSVEELAKLQKAEIYRLNGVIENLPGSIYWKDKDGVYLGINRYSSEMMKLAEPSHSEIVGKTDYDLFPKDIADEYRKNDLKVMKTGKEVMYEESHSLPEGKKCIQHSYKRPLYGENGEVIGLVGNTIDITKLKETEQKLLEAKNEAELANDAKSEFIRNMEHDIRTPVNGVLAMANILKGKENDANKKECLDDIANCARELLNYCNSVLDFSRIVHGTIPILARKIDIRELIDSVITMEIPPAKNKQLDLISEFDDNVPKIIIGDDARLQRVLINLVSNAIKFTNQGYVKISVKAAKASEKKTIILQVIIEDTGIGIPKNKQEYIYEKFTRVEPSNQGIYKGSGLGLRIVKKLIEEMEGEIDVESEPGAGSKFTCTLPVKLPLITGTN